jgi:hypothetical protein
VRPLFAALVLGLGVLAAEAAEPWGIPGEQTVQFKARVVDLVCALTGDCPPDCGGGKRQFGLLTDSGTLRAAVKASSNFAGPVRDLLPYCDRTVEVDGLLIDNPAMTLVMVQNIKENPAAVFQPTLAFEREWARAHGAAEEWYRADPTVQRIIEAGGVFGLAGTGPKP